MKNLAGNQDADKTIQEELYLAGIPAVKVDKAKTEVPYSFVGKVGKWAFQRLWYYWSAQTENPEDGFTFDMATQLYHKKHPFDKRELGKSIRCAGHAGGVTPAEFGAHPIHDAKFRKALVDLGWEEKYYESLKEHYIDITVGQVSELYKSGRLTDKEFPRYVNSYHIDDQIALNEFATALQVAELV